MDINNDRIFSITISEAEHATIIAALRFAQSGGNANPFEIEKIATMGHTFPKLNAKGIDRLCEHLNFETKAVQPALIWWDVTLQVTAIDNLEAVVRIPSLTECGAKETAEAAVRAGTIEPEWSVNLTPDIDLTSLTVVSATRVEFPGLPTETAPA